MSLLWLLLHWGSRRFVNRVLASLAFSIGLSQSLLCLLSSSTSPRVVAHWMGLTLVWSLLIAAIGSFFLTSGFLDPGTEKFLFGAAQRRRCPPTALSTVEFYASTAWLLILACAPLLAVSIVALTRAHSLAELSRLAVLAGVLHLAAALGTVLFATAINGLRKARFGHPRLLLISLVFGPELLRLIDPSLGTCRTLLASLPEFILSWSHWS